MFYRVRFSKEILVHPSVYRPGILDKVKQELSDLVVGKCSEEYGLLLKIIEIYNYTPIHTDEPMLALKLYYKALAFQPVPDEILDAEVTHVEQVGLYVVDGPISCFISRQALPDELKYCQIGNSPCYKSDNENKVIALKDKIRVKVVSTRVKENEIFAIVTLLDETLRCPSVHSYYMKNTHFNIHVQ